MSSECFEPVVIVTGANKGIGAATAVTLLDAGARVVLASRDAEQCNKLLDNCKYFTRALSIQVDVRNMTQVNEMVNKIIQKWGVINALVNNAGVACVARIDDLSEQDWQNVLDINLGGAIRCIQSVVPIMKANRQGRIVNISSQAGYNGEALASIYSTSKAALIGLTQSLARELGSYGITVNSVCPGRILTSMYSDSANQFSILTGVSDEFELQWRKSIPAGRLGEPNEVAELVKFLVMGESRYINGASIAITGGLTVH